MALEHKGILEGLLYTAGDEGLEARQIMEVLEITEDELNELAASYQAPGLIIQQYGTTYVLTTKSEAIEYETLASSNGSIIHYRL